MIGRIIAIAANTFRETIRNKILYAIMAFALLVIGMTIFLADLTIGELSRIIVDLGLASIHLFGVVAAVFVGITLISQELDRKTVFLILSKAVPRHEFLMGKALGLSATLALTTFTMALVLFLVHAGYRHVDGPEPGIIVASVGIYMELVLLVCIASLFSTFTTPTLSAIFTLAIFFIGHITGDLLHFGSRAGSPFLSGGAKALYYLLPNLELFNWKNEATYGTARSFGRIIPVAAYLLAYCAAVMTLACLLFSRKDFK
jgi:ABC-type transport system involved in multi-copper enzyme maturation permease subunit